MFRLLITAQVPDAVKFKAAHMLSGYWEPYPISMTFEPPCMTISIIGLSQPGSIAAVSLHGGTGCVNASGHSSYARMNAIGHSSCACACMHQPECKQNNLIADLLVVRVAFSMGG
jgi:hypothetical protein